MIILFLMLILAVIAFDLGNYSIHESGAGDIWWTEVSAILEIY